MLRTEEQWTTSIYLTIRSFCFLMIMQVSFESKLLTLFKLSKNDFEVSEQGSEGRPYYILAACLWIWKKPPFIVPISSSFGPRSHYVIVPKFQYFSRPCPFLVPSEFENSCLRTRLYSRRIGPSTVLGQPVLSLGPLILRWPMFNSIQYNRFFRPRNADSRSSCNETYSHCHS